MGSQEVLESNMDLYSTAGSGNLNIDCLCNNGFESEEMGSDDKHNGSSNFDILKDLDTMMEDINNRLRVSRMVSDSVIKGIVNAVEQDADEKIKAKEVEVASLKQFVVWADKFNEISGLRNDLDSLSKLLLSSDSGNLLSHGSFDTEPLSSQISSRWEDNGKSDGSKTDVPDTFDAVQLKHLNHEGLVNFFNNRISMIKREHESTVQHMTENYISLKGKYLSERQSVLPHSKDFETLKKKIPQVISKLDKVLVECDKFPECGNDGNNLDSLKDRLDTHLSEKRQIRDSFADNKSELKCLSSQVSVASNEESVQTLMKTLNLSTTDSCIEASIIEDVYKCVIGELGGHIKSMKEESELQIIAMQEVYEVLLKEASIGSKTTKICETNDSYTELLFMQGLSETIFEETLKEAQQKHKSLFDEYLTVSLEKKSVKREAEIILEVEEREKSRKDELMEEKEHIARELTQVREHFKVALDELDNLRKQASWHETLISKTNRELDEMSGNLLKAKNQIELDKIKITSLNQKLEIGMEEKKAADDLRNRVLALTQEKQSYTSFIEAKEKEHGKHMEAVVVLVDGLSTKIADFECRVRGDILRHNTRLESSSSELHSLIKEANVLKRTGLLYKQKLERKCSDLQMAEDEVDLLGDEVETLVGLLEKIYVALDHYSPVLQYYPGVIEILKLIRTEFSGESLK